MPTPKRFMTRIERNNYVVGMFCPSCGATRDINGTRQQIETDGHRSLTCVFACKCGERFREFYELTDVRLEE